MSKKTPKKLLVVIDLFTGGSFFLLPTATKLGQGNIFTPVCHSVHRGGSTSVHAGIPPPNKQTPPPPMADPPRSRHHPPQWQTPPKKQTPQEADPPPPKKQAPAYGQ